VRINNYYFMQPSSQTAVRAQNSDRLLVIMAKAPRAGLVKTRLASSLPVEAVTELYRCLLEDTIALASSLRGAEVAIMCPESDLSELARFAGNGARLVAQKGAGLAAGLISVFARFAEHGQRVIAFNSDSPHLPPSVLETAFAILARHDLVVGPTHDGGYYLVGAKASYPTLFARDEMGTAGARERLLANARTLHLSVGFVEPFYDIDVADDLTRLAEELRLAPARAPRTAAWLKDWELGSARSRTNARTSAEEL
jgi:uncharacterized protein